jgi:hypothetical protein
MTPIAGHSFWYVCVAVLNLDVLGMDGKEPESTQILRKSMMSQVHTHYSPVDM